MKKTEMIMENSSSIDDDDEKYPIFIKKNPIFGNHFQTQTYPGKLNI